METRSVLALDLGALAVRACRVPIGEAAPEAAPDERAIPALLELAPEADAVAAFGDTALRRLVSGEGLRFAVELKSCLAAVGERVEWGGGETPSSCTPEEAWWRVEELLHCVAWQLAGAPEEPAATDWRLHATVPGYWNEAVRQQYHDLLKRCFRTEAVTLTGEPEAALGWYQAHGALAAERRAPTVLVVDLGHTATQVALARPAADGTFSELRCYAEGIGGRQFDAAVARHIAGQLRIPVGEELPLALRQRGQQLKERFSHNVASGAPAASAVALTVARQFYTGTVLLDRATFESEAVAGPLVAEFAALIQRALGHFGVVSPDIGSVLLAGGGAEWYFVPAVLREVLGDCPILAPPAPATVTLHGLLAGDPEVAAATLAAPVADVNPHLPVVPAPTTPPAPRAPDVTRPVRRSNRWRAPLLWSGASVVAVAAIVGGALAFRKPPKKQVIKPPIHAPANLPTNTPANVPDAPGQPRFRLSLRQTLAGHDSPVWAASLSRDGRRVATRSEKEIAVWDTETGKNRWRSPDAVPAENTVSLDNSITLSPDGAMVAAPAGNGVKLWDTETGKLRRQLEGSRYPVASIAISPDSAWLAAGTGDFTKVGEVDVWDLISGKKRWALPGHEDVVRALAFSPAGALLASGTYPSARLWDLHAGRMRRALTAENDDVHSVAFSPDGTLLAVAQREQVVAVWDMETGTVSHRLPSEHYAGDGSGDVFAVAFSPDGSAILVGTRGGRVLAYNPATGQKLFEQDLHEAAVQSLCFSEDGTLLATASQDATVKLWHVETLTAETSAPQAQEPPTNVPAHAPVDTPPGNTLLNTPPTGNTPPANMPR